MSQKRSHHGNTPAAWTAVTIIFVAFVIGGAGILVSNAIVFWAGVVVGIVGAIVGKVMQMAGLGQITSHNS